MADQPPPRLDTRQGWECPRHGVLFDLRHRDLGFCPQIMVGGERCAMELTEVLVVKAKSWN